MPATEPTKPPTEPSTVLLGLTLGASLCFPKALPAKNAPVSLMKAPIKGVRASALEVARSSARLAKAMGSSAEENTPAIAVAKLRAPSRPCVATAAARA